MVKSLPSSALVTSLTPRSQAAWYSASSTSTLGRRYWGMP